MYCVTLLKNNPLLLTLEESNTFKYHVSCTDGTISVRVINFYCLFFHRRPTQKLCFLSCWPFVVDATFSTGLVVSSVSWLAQLSTAYRKENTTYEWDDGGKIGNKNK